MQRPYIRLLLAIVVAGVVSFGAGLGFAEIAGRIPCHGEGLACNIDAAIGAYGVIIAAVLGPLIYAVTLLVAQNRIALGGALLVLLTPIVAFYFLSQGEHWRYVGFYPYKEFRTLMVMALPPALTVVVQWLILRIALWPKAHKGSGSSPSAMRGDKPDSGAIPVSTE
jgi:nitrate/nitrite transporter NarK